jgi:hypothetical protein
MHGRRSAIPCRRRRSAGAWRREGRLRRSNRKRSSQERWDDPSNRKRPSRERRPRPSRRRRLRLEGGLWCSQSSRLRLEGSRLKRPFAIGRNSRPTRQCPYSRYENALLTRPINIGRVNPGQGCPGAATSRVSPGRACTGLGGGPKYQEGIYGPD